MSLSEDRLKIGERHKLLQLLPIPLKSIGLAASNPYGVCCEPLDRLTD